MLQNSTVLTAPAATGGGEASKFLGRRNFFDRFWRCAGGKTQHNMLCK